MKTVSEFGAGVLAVALALAALLPRLDRAWACRGADQDFRLTRTISPVDGDLSLLSLRNAPPLATWASVGGCGAAGGSASGPGGGIKWVGRNVTGGLLDVQALTTDTSSHGSRFGAVSARFGASPTSRLGLGLNVPVLYKTGSVTVLGTTRDAGIAGFGDLSAEASYKLGAIGAHQIMLTGSAPTGASDAVRQGVVLPQRLQLGSGVPGFGAQYQHTQDHDWGLLILGGTASYAGWQNKVGDYRAPSATAFVHAGYLLGPWVPSAGLTVFGKPVHDRERGVDRPADRDALFVLVPSVGFEWSNQWLAVLPAANFGVSYNGFESVTLGLGVSSSLF